MGMLQSYSYPLTPLPQYPATPFYPPLPLYPVSHPAPLPQYPVTPEDSLCESSMGLSGSPIVRWR